MRAGGGAGPADAGAAGRWGDGGGRRPREEEVLPLLVPGCRVAAVNGPSSVVVSGDEADGRWRSPAVGGSTVARPSGCGVARVPLAVDGADAGRVPAVVAGLTVPRAADPGGVERDRRARRAGTVAPPEYWVRHVREHGAVRRRRRGAAGGRASTRSWSWARTRCCRRWIGRRLGGRTGCRWSCRRCVATATRCGTAARRRRHAACARTAGRLAAAVRSAPAGRRTGRPADLRVPARRGSGSEPEPPADRTDRADGARSGRRSRAATSPSLTERSVPTLAADRGRAPALAALAAPAPPTVHGGRSGATG